MGYYINGPKLSEKKTEQFLAWAKENQGLKQVTREEFLAQVPGAGGFGVVVVNNGYMDAAGVAFSPSEARVMAEEERDKRTRKYYIATMDWIKKIDPNIYAKLLKI